MRVKHIAKSHLKLVTPASVKRTVTPKRLPNCKLRTREYLTEAEIERLMAAAKRTAGATGTLLWSLWPIGTGIRVSGPSLGSGGVRNGHPARPQGQAGHSKRASGPRGRATRAATAPTRPGTQVTLRIHFGAGVTLQHRWLRPHGGAGRGRGQAGVQSASTHAQARLWLCAGQQGARHPRSASLSGASQHSAYGALHRIVAHAVQGFLAELIGASPASFSLAGSRRMSALTGNRHQSAGKPVVMGQESTFRYAEKQQALSPSAGL